MDYYYHGVWRMDLGFGNPNKTATLISMLMVAALGSAYVKRWGFWCALVLFTSLGVSLIFTFSRGGLLALFAGLAPVIYFAKRPWPAVRVLGCGVSFAILAFVAIILNATDRYSEGVVTEDRSITNRIGIWKVVPRMILDSPDGWGIGNSGKSYVQWYQPVDRTEQYRTLVSSHLTWLVEFNWPMRFLYIFAWIVTISLCWPSHKLRFLSVALGVWIVFGVAGALSSVEESVWLWLPPLIALIVALGIRFRLAVWPDVRIVLLSFLASIGLFIAFVAFGFGEHGFRIRAINGGIVLGNGDPAVWVFADDKVVGKDYGHILRNYLSSAPSSPCLGITISGKALPQLNDKTVVLAGKVDGIENLRGSLSLARRIIVLNPTLPPAHFNLVRKESNKTLVIFGEFTESSVVRAWSANFTSKRIAGFSDFLPNWPMLVFQNNL